MRKIDARKREQAILNILKTNPTGLSVAEIYQIVTQELEDSVTLQAYWKTIYKMESDGKIEVVESNDGERKYKLAARLMVENPISLEDLYELLPYVRTTQAIAAFIDAENYYEENRKTVLKRAAEALMQEDPRELVSDMLYDLTQQFCNDLELFGLCLYSGNSEDETLIARMDALYREIDRIAYRALSIPKYAFNLKPWLTIRNEIENAAWMARVNCKSEIEASEQISKVAQEACIIDANKLAQCLQNRIFGDKFIYIVDVSTTRGKVEREKVTVSGSDGSIHAGTLALQTARGYYEDHGQIITFNNSVAYSPKRRKGGIANDNSSSWIYSAPLTRQTLDDPSYRGMVLAPFMYPDLSDSVYEHMAKCATDVVQFRVDAAVVKGEARNLLTGELWPKIQVHIRDGTITPQEREFNHYNRLDEYGEMVREGLRLHRSILERIMSSPKPPVFAGAVKTTQLKVFSVIINWYIARGSKKRFGKPIEPNWNISRARMISDNVAMTNLLAALPQLDPKINGKYYVSCAFLRQFPSLTEFYNSNISDGEWKERIEKRKIEDEKRHKEIGGTLTYIMTAELDDDDFIFLCENADYVSFYIGHTGSEPPPLIPRYEFLIGRASDQRTVVSNNVKRLVEALDETSFDIDRDHNFLSGKTLIRIVPGVVQRAHEYVKHIGKKLEQELQSAVIKWLIQLGRIRADNSDAVQIRPVSVRKYLEKYSNALEKNEQRQLIPGVDDSQ